MIEWKKYRPSNPPKLYENYLVYSNKITVAWFDHRGPMTELNAFHAHDNNGIVNGVTHYAEINLPE